MMPSATKQGDESASDELATGPLSLAADGGAATPGPLIPVPGAVPATARPDRKLLMSVCVSGQVSNQEQSRNSSDTEMKRQRLHRLQWSRHSWTAARHVFETADSVNEPLSACLQSWAAGCACSGHVMAQ